MKHREFQLPLPFHNHQINNFKPQHLESSTPVIKSIISKLNNKWRSNRGEGGGRGAYLTALGNTFFFFFGAGNIGLGQHSFMLKQESQRNKSVSAHGIKSFVLRH